MIVTPKVNMIVLNRGADLFYEGAHVFVPLGNVAAKNLPDVLDAIGAGEICVQFNTIDDPKGKATDLKKYGKRLANLSPWWVVGSFAPKVVDGHVFPTVMTCTLTRVDQ